MVKLQKTDIQQRRCSQQPDSSRRSDLPIKPPSHDAESRRASSSRGSRQKTQVMPPTSWTNERAKQDAHRTRNFEHTPSKPEPPFVATGREEFLKRASIIKQTPPNERQTGVRHSKPRPATSQKREQSSSRTPQASGQVPVTIKPGQQTRFSSPSFVPAREHRKEVDRQQNIKSTFSLTSTHENPYSSAGQHISRKRSASLPSQARLNSQSPSRAGVSVVNERIEQPVSSLLSSSPATDLPFAPRVDLETMLDTVSASYNDKLAEAQHRSNMLWKKTFASHRDEIREVGCLRKRQSRRMSSPALFEQSFGTSYSEMKPGSQPQMVTNLSTGSPSGSNHPENKPSRSLDLSDTSLIHPAFRSNQFMTISKPSRCAEGHEAPARRSRETFPAKCAHCGHAQISGQSSTGPSPFRDSDILKHAAPNETEYFDEKKVHMNQRKQSLPSAPGSPMEVSIAERVAATRAILLATSSQESVTSSRTCVAPKAADKSPLFQNRNKSEGDFVSSTRKNGWPMRMTNWKGPFATTSTNTDETIKLTGDIDRIVSIDQPNDKDFSEQSAGQEEPLMSQRQTLPVKRTKSTRRVTIGGDQEGKTFPQENILVFDQSSRLDLDLLSRQCRSPSIYSTDIPSPLLLSHSDSDSPPTPTLWLDGEFESGTGQEPSMTMTNMATPDLNTMILEPFAVLQQSDYGPDVSHQSLGMTSPGPSADMCKVDATNYSLNISRSKNRISQSLTYPSSEINQPFLPPTSASLQPQLLVQHGKNNVVALHLQPRSGTQSLTQFKNNCRPIDAPPSPIVSPSSTRVRFATQSDSEPPLHSKPQMQNPIRSRRRLSKTMPVSQDPSSIPTRQRSRRRSRTSDVSTVNLQTKPKESSTGSQTKPTKIQGPMIPPRTKAHVSTTDTSSPPEQADQRSSRSRLPPNSFPTSKSQADSEDRGRSRSRSRIRSLLQTVGLAAKSESYAGKEPKPQYLGQDHNSVDSGSNRYSNQGNTEVHFDRYWGTHDRDQEAFNAASSSRKSLQV